MYRGIENSVLTAVLQGGSTVLELHVCRGIENSVLTVVLQGGSTVLELHVCIEE